MGHCTAFNKDDLESDAGRLAYNPSLRAVRATDATRAASSGVTALAPPVSLLSPFVPFAPLVVTEGAVETAPGAAEEPVNCSLKHSARATVSWLLKPCWSTGGHTTSRKCSESRSYGSHVGASATEFSLGLGFLRADE